MAVTKTANILSKQNFSRFASSTVRTLLRYPRELEIAILSKHFTFCFNVYSSIVISLLTANPLVYQFPSDVLMVPTVDKDAMVYDKTSQARSIAEYSQVSTEMFTICVNNPYEATTSSHVRSPFSCEQTGKHTSKHAHTTGASPTSMT